MISAGDDITVSLYFSYSSEGTIHSSVMISYEGVIDEEDVPVKGMSMTDFLFKSDDVVFSRADASYKTAYTNNLIHPTQKDVYSVYGVEYKEGYSEYIEDGDNEITLDGYNGLDIKADLSDAEFINKQLEKVADVLFGKAHNGELYKKSFIEKVNNILKDDNEYSIMTIVPSSYRGKDTDLIIGKSEGRVEIELSLGEG